MFIKKLTRKTYCENYHFSIIVYCKRKINYSLPAANNFVLEIFFPTILPNPQSSSKIIQLVKTIRILIMITIKTSIIIMIIANNENE